MTKLCLKTSAIALMAALAVPALAQDVTETGPTAQTLTCADLGALEGEAATGMIHYLAGFRDGLAAGEEAGGEAGATAEGDNSNAPAGGAAGGEVGAPAAGAEGAGPPAGDAVNPEERGAAGADPAGAAVAGPDAAAGAGAGAVPGEPAPGAGAAAEGQPVTDENPSDGESSLGFGINLDTEAVLTACSSTPEAVVIELIESAGGSGVATPATP